MYRVPLAYWNGFFLIHESCAYVATGVGAPLFLDNEILMYTNKTSIFVETRDDKLSKTSIRSKKYWKYKKLDLSQSFFGPQKSGPRKFLLENPYWSFVKSVATYAQDIIKYMDLKKIHSYMLRAPLKSQIPVVKRLEKFPPIVDFGEKLNT